MPGLFRHPPQPQGHAASQRLLTPPNGPVGVSGNFTADAVVLKTQTFSSSPAQLFPLVFLSSDATAGGITADAVIAAVSGDSPPLSRYSNITATGDWKPSERIAPQQKRPTRIHYVAASDTFTRTIARGVSPGWGDADDGGDWFISFLPDVEVDGSQGILYINANGDSDNAYLTRVSIPDFDANVLMSMSALPTGASRNIAELVLRRTQGGEHSYRARLTYEYNGGAIQLNAGWYYTVNGGSATLIGAGDTVTSITPAANTRYNVRAQVLGSSPTTLRMKVWTEGDAEPAAWTIDTTNNQAELQNTTGHVGLRAQNISTNTSLNAKFDNLNVYNTQQADAVDAVVIKPRTNITASGTWRPAKRIAPERQRRLNPTVLAAGTPGSFTADAVALRTQAGSFTADAIVLRTISGSFTADADISSVRLTSRPNITAIGIWRAAKRIRPEPQRRLKPTQLSAETSGSFTADSVLVRTQSGSFTADAVIKKPDTSASFTADAIQLRTWVFGEAAVATNWATVGNGASATASSTFSSYVPANAINETDADPGWSSNVNTMAGEWLQVDLGQARGVAAARVLSYRWQDNVFEIQHSSNGSSWTALCTSMGPPLPQSQLLDVQVNFDTTVTDRYWRIYYTGGIQGNEVRTFELLSVAYARTPSPFNYARREIGAYVEGSVGPFANQYIYYAFDNDDGTLWEPNINDLSAGTTYARVLLPTPKRITSARIYHTTYTNAWNLEYWNGSSWAVAFSGTSPSDTTQAIDITAADWRVRYTSGSSGTDLRQFELWGAGSTAVDGPGPTLDAVITASVLTPKRDIYARGWRPAKRIAPQARRVVVTPTTAQTFSASFTADAIVLRTTSGTFTADAVVLRTQSFTFTADADITNPRWSRNPQLSAIGIWRPLRRIAPQRWRPLNPTFLGSPTADSFTADAEITAPVWARDPNLTAQGIWRPLKRIAPQRWRPLNPTFFTVEASGAFTADAVVLRTQSGSFTADAVIKKTLSFTLTADAVIVRTTSGSFTADAVVLRTQSGSFTADADISSSVLRPRPNLFSLGWRPLRRRDPARERHITFPGFLASETAGSFTADAITKATITGSFTADASIRTGTSGQLTVDAVLFKTISGSFTADAEIIGPTLGVRRPAFRRPQRLLPAAQRKLHPLQFAVEHTGSFTADAITLRTTSSSLTADAVILRPQTGSFTADAVLVRTVAGSFTADAVLKKTLSFSFTADAVLLRTTSGSFTADAVVLRTTAASFTADADISARVLRPRLNLTALAIWRAAKRIRPEPQRRLNPTNFFVTGSGSFTADSVLLRTQSGSFSANAVLLKTFSSSFTADAIVKRTQAGSFTADAILFRTQAASFTADAILFRTQSASFTADAIVRTPGTGSFTSDAIVLATLAASFTADAVLKRTISGSFSADAVIMPTFTADAVVLRSQTGSFTADAVIMPVFWADAVLLRTQSGSFTADSFVAGVGVAAISADAVIKATISGSFTVDAVVRQTRFFAVTADGVFHRVTSASLTADAIILRQQSAAFTADAWLLRNQTGSFTADACVRRTQVGAFTADAILFRNQTGAFTADAVIKRERTGSFTADSVIRRTQSASFTADAFIFAIGAFTFTADAVVRRTQSATVTADAVLRIGRVGSFTADAVIRKTLGGSLTADAVLLQVRPFGLTANAVFLSPRTGTFTADAVIRRGRTGSFTADACVRRTASGSFTADAFIRSGFFFTADAVLRAVHSASVTADAVISDAARVTGSFTADAVISPWLAIYSTLDLDALASTLDLQALVSTLDIQVLVSTLDVDDQLVSTLDIQELVSDLEAP